MRVDKGSTSGACREPEKERKGLMSIRGSPGLQEGSAGTRTEKGKLGVSLGQDSGVQVTVQWVASD